MAEYLVVAHQTASSSELVARASELAANEPEVSFTLLIPATPPSHLLTWEGGEAVATARKRGQEARVLFEAHSLRVSRTEVGDRSPLLAIEDELRTHHGIYKAIVLCTLPPGISRWLKLDVHHQAERKFTIPVIHVLAQQIGEPQSTVAPRPLGVTQKPKAARPGVVPSAGGFDIRKREMHIAPYRDSWHEFEAFQDLHLIGRIVCFEAPLWSGDCWIHDLWVDHRMRRSGVGKQLLAAAIETARSHRYLRLLGELRPYGDASKADIESFFKGLGFAVEEHWGQSGQPVVLLVVAGEEWTELERGRDSRQILGWETEVLIAIAHRGQSTAQEIQEALGSHVPLSSLNEALAALEAKRLVTASKRGAVQPAHVFELTQLGQQSLEEF